jgi:hypothetical protein
LVEVEADEQELHKNMWPTQGQCLEETMGPVELNQNW